MTNCQWGISIQENLEPININLDEILQQVNDPIQIKQNNSGGCLSDNH